MGFLAFFGEYTALARHISFKRSAFESHWLNTELYPEHVIAIVQEQRYVLLKTCLLNLLVPCTAANSIGHYVVGVVAMG